MAQADKPTTELARRVEALEREREVYLQDRLVIALTTAFELETHGAELADYLKNQRRITFPSNDFVVLSFAGTQTDPDLRDFTPIWNTIVSPKYLELRNLILSVTNLRHVGLTCDIGGRIICILNFAANTGDFYEEICQLCGQINDLAQKRGGGPFEIDVSEPGAGLASLPGLRRQIDTLHDYRITMRGHAPALLFYDHIVSPAQEFPIFVKTMNEQFSEYLGNGQFEKAKLFFRETIIGDFVSSPPPLNMIRFRLSALIDYVIQAIYQSCNALGLQDTLQAAGMPEVLLACTSIEDLAARLDTIFDTLSASWSPTGSATLHLAQAARTYINANYANPNLNVNLAAAQLQVTATHLTRSFQACYGCGVLEYLQSVRLSAAKQLLGGDLSMREIAMRTGYGSPLNMSRAFKRCEGKTPSEYLSKN